MSGNKPEQSGTNDVLKGLGFETLSEGISLYTPKYTTAATTPPTDPTLLVLCSWAFAQPRHIAKYITPYLSIYPATSILLIQNVIRNLIYIPDAWQYSFFEPAATMIQAHVSSRDHPRVLLHIFSNGGAHAAVQLSEACRETCGGMRLPVDAIILDSTPGIPRARSTVNAMVHGVPSGNPILRGTAAALSWLMVSTTGLCEMLRIMEPAARKLYRLLVDPYDVFMFKGAPRAETDRKPVPRAYMYSKTDATILEEDVVAHAKLAMDQLERLGLGADKIRELIKMEEFVGTAHVNHVKGDADRYWAVVKETWERSQRT